MLFALRYKVYADYAVKISGIITVDNANLCVGTLGLSVRVTMKTSNGNHAKRHRLYVYDITRTLRPSVLTRGWHRLNELESIFLPQVRRKPYAAKQKAWPDKGWLLAPNLH